MRTRVISSLAVVVIGLVPTLMGGPIFTVLIASLGVTGFREYLALATRVGPEDLERFAGVGLASILGFALAALFDAPAIVLFAAAAFAVTAPLIAVFRSATNDGAFLSWSLVSIGSLYLGLPMFAAIALRSSPGELDAAWITGLTERLSFGWDAHPRGLAWAVTVMVCTWAGDSAAYLIGRAVGTRKLAPGISPNKTVEGAIAGFVVSAGIGGLAFSVFTLGHPWLGLAAGGALGIAGQFGDLGESVLKRQAGVKDSGSMIPGHGGVLDRIDAQLFAFPAGLLIATVFDWLPA